MASYFYGINYGQNEYQAVVATSTQSTDFEVNVNNANVTTKEDLLKGLDQLRDFALRQVTWPPVAAGQNYLGVNFGQNEYQAVVNTVTNSTDIEIRVNTTNAPARADFCALLDSICNWIIRNTFPPL